MSALVRIELYVDGARADAVAEAIINEAHIGLSGEGIVAIHPVEQLFQISQGGHSRQCVEKGSVNKTQTLKEC